MKEMDFEITEKAPNVYLALFHIRYDLCMSFIRIQEFYESPNDSFRGKFFTLEDYIDWYSFQEGAKGEFKYATQWSGFNIPGIVLQEWIKIYSIHRMRDKEIELLDKLRPFSKKGYDNLYLIGACKEDKKHEATIEHELSHAMYTLDESYRNECERLLAEISVDKKNRYIKILRTAGYADNVLNDEMQAYLSAGGGSRVKITLNKKFAKNFEDHKTAQ